MSFFWVGVVDLAPFFFLSFGMVHSKSVSVSFGRPRQTMKLKNRKLPEPIGGFSNASEDLLGSIWEVFSATQINSGGCEITRGPFLGGVFWDFFKRSPP